jgi:hypothetical protein
MLELTKRRINFKNSNEIISLQYTKVAEYLNDAFHSTLSPLSLHSIFNLKKHFIIKKLKEEEEEMKKVYENMKICFKGN